MLFGGVASTIAFLVVRGWDIGEVHCIGTSIIFHFLLMLSSVSIVIEEEIQTNKKNGDRQRCNIVMRF